MDPISLLTKLNELGSKNGVGTIDIIENRLVGMKSRGVYETPGGTILFAAHAGLEQLILDRDTTQYKNIVSQKFAQLVYDGLWFTPLREAISAFVDVTQKEVTGTVKMKLYKGVPYVAAKKSPYSLYNEEFATFSKDEVYNQQEDVYKRQVVDTITDEVHAFLYHQYTGLSQDLFAQFLRSYVKHVFMPFFQRFFLPHADKRIH